MSKSKSLDDFINEARRNNKKPNLILPQTPSETRLAPHDIKTASQFFQILYPNAPANHQLVLSYLPRHTKKAKLLNFWIRAHEIKDVNEFVDELVQDELNVYFGVGLRRPNFPVNPETGMPPLSKRGRGEDVTLLPGLWIDIDHAGGAHQTENPLPTKDELEGFIKTLPFETSLIVDTGGGLHLYVLFRRLWRLKDTQEQYRAHALLIRFQRSVQVMMAKEGWHCDSTYDLSRVLRPVGSVNFKREAVPVTCTHYSGRRYRVETLEQASWMLPLVTKRRRMHVPFTGRWNEGKPGEAFDKYCTRDVMLTILEEHDWTYLYEDGDGVVYLTRPGKEGGISGTLGCVGPNVFHCFTSSAPPLDGQENYGPFRLYTVLEHQGNFGAAAKVLARKGYGDPRWGAYDTLEYVEKGGVAWLN